MLGGGSLHLLLQRALPGHVCNKESYGRLQASPRRPNFRRPARAIGPTVKPQPHEMTLLFRCDREGHVYPPSGRGTISMWMIASLLRRSSRATAMRSDCSWSASQDRLSARVRVSWAIPPRPKMSRRSAS
jgi:hypothetical protein